ncbi:MAG: lipocalin family protein [Bacteroidota bacterium]
MKSLFIFSLLAIFSISSCGTPYDSSQKNTGIVGNWTLVKEVKNNKVINYDGIPTASKYEFKENGYYVYYDKITNEKIAKSGVGTIQDIEKGQFMQEDADLKLNHYLGDSLVTKTLIVKEQTATHLTLFDETTNKTSHFKK